MQLRLPRAPHSGRGFTLIELLVVISIIAILASLALPALNGALNAAKKAQANAMISQLKVAVTGFNTEYGTWPMSPTGDTVLAPSDLYHVLIGDTTGAGTASGNTRQIVFMEFASKDTNTAGTSAVPSMFVDPWYRTNGSQAGQNYQVKVDGDFDNTLSSLPVGAGGPTTINAGVAIWDPGPPVTKGTVNSDSSTGAKNILKSW